MMEERGWSDVMKGPCSKDYRWPPEAIRGKKKDSPLEPPEGTSPAATLTVAQ